MNLHEYMLTKLQEEALEVAHAISKAKTLGLHDVNPSTGTTNAEHILQEFAEFQGTLELSYEFGVPLPTISDEALHDRKEAKKAKILKYMLTSIERGTLDLTPEAVDFLSLTPEPIFMSSKDVERFIELTSNPPPPNDRLREAMTRHLANRTTK